MRSNPQKAWEKVCAEIADAQPPGFNSHPAFDPLDEHFPDRASKVMSTIQSLRGGRENDPNFFSRMQGQGPWADLIRTRFEKAAARYGLQRSKFGLRRDLFQPPQGNQLRLL